MFDGSAVRFKGAKQIQLIFEHQTVCFQQVEQWLQSLQDLSAGRRGYRWQLDVYAPKPNVNHGPEKLSLTIIQFKLAPVLENILNWNTDSFGYQVIVQRKALKRRELIKQRRRQPFVAFLGRRIWVRPHDVDVESHGRPSCSYCRIWLGGEACADVKRKRPRTMLCYRTEGGPSLRFEWDSTKATANVSKHEVSFDEAVTVFSDPLARIFNDEDHSIHERREIIIGYSAASRLLLVCYSVREQAIRIFSARTATSHERADYEENVQQ